MALGAAMFAAQARAGDAAVGANLTQRWCSGCHVIGNASNGQDTAPSLPPNGQDQKWVRAWLADPHPPMPDLHLSREEIDDIVAYLSSLPRK